MRAAEEYSHDMARLNRRYRKKRRNPSDGGSRANPPLFAEVAEFVIPGFAAFGVTRFGTRLAVTQIEQRKPSWGKHAGAVASVGSFLAAWFLAHRWKWLAKYQTPLVVGSAIAALQSLVQLYVPKLGWMVSDASPELAATVVDPQLQGGTSSSALPDGMVATDDDPNLYVYNDAYDSGAYSQPASGKPNPSATQQQNLDDLMIDDQNESAQNMGIFNS